MRVVSLLLIFLLAACEQIAVQKISSREFEISSSVESVSWTPHHPGAYTALKALAKENCPNGWAVLNEKTEIRNGKEYIIQRILCN